MSSEFKPFSSGVVPLYLEQFDLNSPSELEGHQPWIASQSATKHGHKYSKNWTIGKQRVLPGLSNDHALILEGPAQYYALSSRLERTLTVDGSKPLYLQYEVKYSEVLNCSGAYLKLLHAPSGVFDSRKFNDQTQFSLLFGPDYCGGEMDEILFHFSHKNPITGQISVKKLVNPPKTAGNTSLSSLYGLLINTDQIFKIFLNGQVVREGSLLTDFEPAVNPPAFIDDPADAKPAWWDERELILDPTAVQPPGSSGWQAPMILNPKYTGKWIPRQIANPEYFQDAQPNKLLPISAVGVEVWTAEAGVSFDNIIMTHDKHLLDSFTQATWEQTRREELIKLEKLLSSAATPQDDLERIGRQDYDWTGSGYILPEGIIDRASFYLRDAPRMYHQDPDQFKAQYALPVLLGCIASITVAVLIRAAIERALRPKEAKKKILDDEEVPVLPRDIQKTNVVTVPAAKPEPGRRERQFSSPLQFQASISAPSTPNDLRTLPIIEEPEF